VANFRSGAIFYQLSPTILVNIQGFAPRHP